MKKILLMLFVPVSLFAQFEDDYYIVRGEEEEARLKDYNISTNTLNNEYNLSEFVEDDNTYMHLMNFQLLTYIPNSDNLFLMSREDYLSEVPESFFHLIRCNVNDIECKFNGYVGHGALGHFYSFNELIGITGKMGNGHHFYGLRERHDTQGKSVDLVIFNTQDDNNWVEQNTIKNISEYVKKQIDQWGGVTYYPNPGLALNPDSNVLYFIGENLEEQPVFYSYNVNSDQIEELPTNFGNIPFYRFSAMHFMRGQNKIMMADSESGDFYIYDLNTNFIELYAETSLTNIVGIVNKHDFLGNIEVYNQGEIKIYPNPVKENLQIEANSQIQKIELFNIIGQKLKEFNSNAKTLNLSKESKGVYILKIQMKNGKIETKKIIKN